MTIPHRYWLALHPDIRKPIGGVKQMHRFAEALNACGRQATLIQERADFHPGWFESKVETTSFTEWKKRQDLNRLIDVVVLPETFLPTIPHYGPGLAKLLFNQNGAYSFGLKKGDGFPENPQSVLKLYHHPELVHALCVSVHDQKLLTSGFGLGKQKVSRIINAIETTVFKPSGKKKRILSYMPRKNNRDASIVTALLKEQPWFKNWRLQPIHGLPQSEVANLLQNSVGFLSFGHPEGFGLPLAEAAACGCALIGYSGLGGREIFRLAKEREVGWEVEFGDWHGFIESIEKLVHHVEQRPKSVLDQIEHLSENVRKRYSQEAMIQSVEDALFTWESQLNARNF